jgi:mRNA interferase MazF
MPSTTSYNFGDVVLVAFPFTNLQATKKHPAVIISNHAYQQTRPDVILMAITSKIRQPLTIGEAILQNWQTAGLARPSVLKPLIATLEQKQIVKVIGQLSVADRKSLKEVIQTILGDS